MSMKQFLGVLATLLTSPTFASNDDVHSPSPSDDFAAFMYQERLEQEALNEHLKNLENALSELSITAELKSIMDLHPIRTDYLEEQSLMEEYRRFQPIEVTIDFTYVPDQYVHYLDKDEDTIDEESELQRESIAASSGPSREYTHRLKCVLDPGPSKLLSAVRQTSKDAGDTNLLESVNSLAGSAGDAYRNLARLSMLPPSHPAIASKKPPMGLLKAVSKGYLAETPKGVAHIKVTASMGKGSLTDMICRYAKTGAK